MVAEVKLSIVLTNYHRQNLSKALGGEVPVKQVAHITKRLQSMQLTLPMPKGRKI